MTLKTGSNSAILEVENLSVALPGGLDRAYAVDNVSLTVKRRKLLVL